MLTSHIKIAQDCYLVLKQDCNRLNSAWENAPDKWFTCMHSTAFFYRTTACITKYLRIKYTSRCEAGQFPASFLPDHICQGCCLVFSHLYLTLCLVSPPHPDWYNWDDRIVPATRESRQNIFLVLNLTRSLSSFRIKMNRTESHPKSCPVFADNVS